MNYSALIQNRKTIREFSDRKATFRDFEELRSHHAASGRALLPQLQTELRFFGADARQALEGAAGYEQFLPGAPQYLVLLSEVHPLAHLNAGFIMEDLLLKLTDMGLDSCWLTFTSSAAVKKALDLESNLEVAAIAAFGYGKRTVRRMKLNILSMSNVDVAAKHRYMEPKRAVKDLAFLNTWGNAHKLEEHIGFFDDMLWEALYAASLAPSYLNRQAYGFVLGEGSVSLVARPDSYNTPIDGDLSLGAVLLHFTAVAEAWTGKLRWDMEGTDTTLPEDHRLVARCDL